jgi:hypothetical protein
MLEWESIAAAEWDEEKIRKRWARLAELRRVADKKALPHGLPRRPKLEKATATAYFKGLYSLALKGSNLVTIVREPSCDRC